MNPSNTTLAKSANLYTRGLASTLSLCLPSKIRRTQHIMLHLILFAASRIALAHMNLMREVRPLFASQLKKSTFLKNNTAAHNIHFIQPTTRRYGYLRRLLHSIDGFSSAFKVFLNGRDVSCINKHNRKTSMQHPNICTSPVQRPPIRAQCTNCGLEDLQLKKAPTIQPTDSK